MPRFALLDRLRHWRRDSIERCPRSSLLAVLALLVAAVAFYIRKHFGPVSTDQLLFHFQQGGMDHADPTLVWKAIRFLLLTGVLMAVLLWLLPRLRRAHRHSMVLLLLVWAGWSVSATLDMDCRQQGDDYLGSHYQDPALAHFTPPAQQPDVLIVFFESLDEAYADPSIVGEKLVPQLDQWRSEHGASWGQMHNLRGATWTIGGMFAALCGVPLQSVGLMSHNRYELADRFFSKGLCLTDVLAQAGWEVSFYGGASPQFAGKGRFLAGHSVSRIFGKEVWMEQKQAVPDGRWGLPDGALLKLALQDMNRPRPDHKPRVHLLLTVNTHPPAGVRDADCPLPAALQGVSEDDAAEPLMRHAYRCSDKLVAEFLRRYSQQADGRDKLVWLMGDHITQLNPLQAALEAGAKRQPRTVFHSLSRFDGQGRPVPLEQPRGRVLTHVDVFPTLLSAMGFRWTPAAGQLALGRSVLTPAAGATLAERDGFAPMDRALRCSSPRFQALW